MARHALRTVAAVSRPMVVAAQTLAPREMGAVPLPVRQRHTGGVFRGLRQTAAGWRMMLPNAPNRAIRAHLALESLSVYVFVTHCSGSFCRVRLACVADRSWGSQLTQRMSAGGR